MTSHDPKGCACRGGTWLNPPSTELRFGFHCDDHLLARLEESADPDLVRRPPTPGTGPRRLRQRQRLRQNQAGMFPPMTGQGMCLLQVVWTLAHGRSQSVVLCLVSPDLSLSPRKEVGRGKSAEYAGSTLLKTSTQSQDAGSQNNATADA